MDAETRKFLDTLKEDGFDVSNLETQINTNPILEAKAKMNIGGSVLRQSAFTKMMQDANATKLDYENKVKQLAAGNDTINSLSDDDPVKKALMEINKAQIDLLVEEGYKREELEALSYNAMNLAVTNKKVEEKVVEKKVEDKEVPQDMSKYVNIETLEKQAEMGVYASVGTNALVNAAIEEAREIGIKVPREKLLSLTAELKRKVDAGENVVNVIDQHFGLVEGRQAYAKATYDKEIANAHAAGRAEGLKENVPSRRVTKLGGDHAILDNSNINRRITSRVEAKKEVDDNKELPRNKYGDVEVFRIRGDQDSRLDRQMSYMDKVVEGTNAIAE